MIKFLDKEKAVFVNTQKVNQIPNGVNNKATLDKSIFLG
jgi:hypothetical protein